MFVSFPGKNLPHSGTDVSPQLLIILKKSTIETEMVN